VWIAASLALGAWTGLQIPLSSAPVVVAGLTFLLIATVLAFVSDDARGVLCRALAGCVVASWALASYGEREARAPPLAVAAGSQSPPVRLEGRLVADAVPGHGSVRLKLDVSRLAGGGVPVHGDAALNVTGAIAMREWPAWRAGRTLAVPSTVRRPACYLDTGVIDDRLSLARRGLVLVGSVKSGALVDVVAHGSWLEERAADVRAFVRRAMALHVGPRDPIAAAVATAILIGDRTGLPPDLEDRLQRAGTYHVIAISGGNIAIFAATLVGLARLFRVSPRIAHVGIVMALWGYAVLVGGGASVTRATAMASAFLLLRVFDLSAAPFAALATASAALLAVDPMLIADPGYVLTVGATSAIVVLTPRLMAWREWPPGVRAAVAVMLASVATELVLLPVSAALFGRVTFAGPLLNLLAVPAMAVVQQAGLVVVATAAWSPALASVAGAVTTAGAEMLVGSGALVDWLPFAARRVPAPSWWVTLSYFTGLVLALGAARVLVWHGRWRVLGRATGIALTTVMACWVVWHPGTWRVPWRGDGCLHVLSIDVGQGDATLIELPDRTSVLVDTGGLSADARYDIGARVVAPAMWARGIGWLDGLLLTHGDPDHIGGATSVLDIFGPPLIWDGIVVPSHTPMNALRERARRARLTWQMLRASQRWKHAGVTFQIWNPPEPDWERRKVRNDDSVVLELRYGDVSILLPGDISAEVERELLARIPPAPFRVLKAPHHGSASSSSDPFLDALKPSIALVSCGRDNRFGHPAPAVLARYAARHVQVFRTDRDGEIELSTNGRNVEVVTFSGRHLVRPN
jgi:competence protein ComEC